MIALLVFIPVLILTNQCWIEARIVQGKFEMFTLLFICCSGQKINQIKSICFCQVFKSLFFQVLFESSFVVVCMIWWYGGCLHGNFPQAFLSGLYSELLLEPSTRNLVQDSTRTLPETSSRTLPELYQKPRPGLYQRALPELSQQAPPLQFSMDGLVR